MSVYVVDASVSAKWFIEEEHREAALSVLDQSHQLHAPEFLFLEMDSVICKWVRRGVVNQKEGASVRRALRQYPIKLHPHLTLLDPAFAIASGEGRSVYDSLYIALAILLDAQMLTADRKLYNALKKSPFKKNITWVEDIK